MAAVLAKAKSTIVVSKDYMPPKAAPPKPAPAKAAGQDWRLRPSTPCGDREPREIFRAASNLFRCRE